MTTAVGSIEFACPYCEKVTRVPATYAGKQGKCPGCQRVIEVPDPSAGGAAAQVTTYEPPPPGAIGTAVTGAHQAPGSDAPLFDYKRGEATTQPIGTPVADVAPVGSAAGGRAEVAERTRPCPSCGESIKAAAKKCKFCGEFLDDRLRAQRRSPGVPVGRLASPWTRLAAAFLDNMLVGLPTGLLAVGGAIVLENARNNGAQMALGFGLLGLAFLVYLSYHAYSWYLISTRGQNIPKGWLGIKIVRIDGQPVDFVSGVLLRNWVYYAVNLVPYIGACFWWAGYLLILGQDRRCLHDHIASTVVVEV